MLGDTRGDGTLELGRDTLPLTVRASHTWTQCYERHTGMLLIILPERRKLHILDAWHLAEDKNTNKRTHISVVCPYAQRHTRMCSHIQMILKLYRLCHMNCLLCGVMCDNQVCNLLRSYRGPLRCIRMIYGQLYLTIIAILQNMSTGIRSYIDTTGCIVTAHAFSYCDILSQKTCSLGALFLLGAVGFNILAIPISFYISFIQWNASKRKQTSVLGAVHILRQPPEGGGGGQANADDCWRRGEGE